MNKLKTVIYSLKYAVLLLFFIFFGVTVNGQSTPQNIKTTQDTIPVNKPIDTVPAIQQSVDSLKTPTNISTLDSMSPATQSADTIKKIVSGPIVLEKNKKYLLGGISVIGNETISEQSILKVNAL